jgi:ABC-type multidrug transport system ATPase subunit
MLRTSFRVHVACLLFLSLCGGRITFVFFGWNHKGLDSSSAFRLIRAVRAYVQRGRLAVAVIHQPTRETLALFHQVVMLAPIGRVAYEGSPDAKHMVSYFERECNVNCPEHTNAADFAMGKKEDSALCGLGSLVLTTVFR